MKLQRIFQKAFSARFGPRRCPTERQREKEEGRKEEKVAGASSIINEGDSYTEEKVAGASAMINEGENYYEGKEETNKVTETDTEIDTEKDAKRLKLSVTCDDLSLLSFSVLIRHELRIDLG